MAKNSIILLIGLFVLIVAAVFLFFYNKKDMTEKPEIFEIKYPCILKAFLYENEENKAEGTYLGDFIVDEKHNLSFRAVRAEGEKAKEMQEAADEINAKTFLYLKSDQASGKDSEILTRLVKKGEGDWALAVWETLDKNYGIHCQIAD